MSDDVARGGRKWIGVGIAALLLLAAVAFAVARHRADSGAASGVAALTVGDQRGAAQALLRAAGELDHVPYPIEWALFPAASPLLEALNSGAIDVGGVGGPPFAFAYAGGAKIKVVFAYRSISGKGSKVSAIVVKGNSPLRSWADLKGKKVATVHGSAGQDLVYRLIARHGLKPSDIHWVYLANSEAKAALENGSVDAWSTWGSYVGTAVLHSGDRVFADATELPSESGFYAASDKAIATKRPQIADFVQRLARARRWALAHRDAYAAALAKDTGLPPDVAQYTIAGYQYKAVPIDRSVVQDQQSVMERYRDAGLIAKVPDLNGAFDPSFSSTF